MFFFFFFFFGEILFKFSNSATTKSYQFFPSFLSITTGQDAVHAVLAKQGHLMQGKEENNCVPLMSL